MQLNIGFLIPRHHRSVTTTQGYVFLTGGIEINDNDDKKQKVLRNSYILNFEKRTLVPVAKMLIGRIEHNLVVLNDEIYAIGGYTDQDEFTSSCEKYCPREDCWTQLPSLKTPCHNSSTCTFNNRYIYRIGGKLDYSKVIERIDRFDVSLNKWEEIHLDFSNIGMASKAYFRINSLSASVQVSYDSILVFGGTLEQYTKKSKGSYLLKIKKDGICHELTEVHQVLAVNEHQLPTAEAFWSQQVIVHDRKLFALQNISMEEMSQNVCLDKRRVLMFDNSKFTVIS